MRVRTILAAGVFAATAILGSAGAAIADDHDERHNNDGRNDSRYEGDFRACGVFAGAGDGHAYYGNGCAESHWEGENHGSQYGGGRHFGR
ncbi:hypothetical protein C6Y14_04195 [Streptomyces dioscori]|uniref:Uncharacterized protein n=1 Tax=Streptomyces dioscori TaxID=2109333 RepID=A0A2P8QGA5_9ACTN|nr:hypothetical protein [Streptomyces dioscori]PSM45270.1 hypothetical protein C6Y14_04195 [Streptomyces dioscori]